MLRERKASMADRSLSSLTGELLLLATIAAAFATFAARRLGGDEGAGQNGVGGWSPGATGDQGAHAAQRNGWQGVGGATTEGPGRHDHPQNHNHNPTGRGGVK